LELFTLFGSGGVHHPKLLNSAARAELQRHESPIQFRFAEPVFIHGGGSGYLSVSRCNLTSEATGSCGIFYAMPDEFEEGPENLDEPPAFFPYDVSLPAREPGAMGEPVEVQIEGVFAHESNGNISRFVLLSDPVGERRLPILIGPFEAQAIQLVIEGTRPDRPMTHDLIRNLLDRLNATIDRVVIDDFWNTIYYAKLYVLSGEEEMEIDARPSDAIALAIRFEAPIFVSEGILDAAMEE
jgi:bifunctional DNase/RNase